MATTRTEAGKLKEGRFVIIDGEPCTIRSSDHSKPGKHGGSKCRVTGIGIFDKAKREFVSPAGNPVEVPIVEKKKGQVLAIIGDKVQLMDLETYETFEMDKPEETVSEGATINYIEFEGRKKVTGVKED